MRTAFLVLTMTGCASALQQIADLEDRRSSVGVLPYTQSADPAVRARAFWALGRIQDPQTVDALVAGLKDSEASVREEAAFAAGLVGLSWQPLNPAVRERLATALLELPPSARVIEALGRLPTAQAVERLAGLAATDERAALALGVAAKRGAKLETLPASVPLSFARQYLWAMSALPQARAGLLEGLGSAEPETRAISAKGLASVGLAADAEALRGLLGDPDARVAVEAVRGLLKLKLELPKLDGRPAVLLAAAQAYVPVETDHPKLQCRMAIAKDKKAGTLRESAACGPLALHEVGAAPDAKFLTGTSAEQLGALDAIGASKATSFLPQVRKLLASSDGVVAAGAATALAKLGDRESIPAMLTLVQRVLSQEELAPSVAEAVAELSAKEAVPHLQAWLASRNATVRYSAAQALTQLTGAPVVAPQVETAEASPIAETGSGLLIITEQGEIEIELWNEEAPRSAANLWTLAKKGYFDGLTFHRIVPDFVAQGGDPRGDGEGGPGYMIRCEIGHRPYLRGTVGMALSGKDTGGSQFFITHTATPHLDGKYTAFGRVTRGMEVVDQLLEGDRMIKVRALP